MKTKSTLKLLAVVLLLSTLNHPLSTAFAQGTAFTYQGWLIVVGNSSTSGGAAAPKSTLPRPARPLHGWDSPAVANLVNGLLPHDMIRLGFTPRLTP